MISALKDVFKQEINVEAEIYINLDRDMFIVAYGHTENRPTNIGKGKSLQNAFENITSRIDGYNRTRKELLKNIQETSLSLDLYHDEIEEEYILVVKDHYGSKVIGRGVGVDEAFRDLAGNVTASKETDTS